MLDDEITHALGLDDFDFAGLVDCALRNDVTDAEQAALRSPQVIGRFVAHTEAMLAKVEGDLVSRLAECEAVQQELDDIESGGGLSPRAVATAQDAWSAYHRWRPGVLRFKTLLERDLVILREIRDRTGDLHQRVTDLEDTVRTLMP